MSSVFYIPFSLLSIILIISTCLLNFAIFRLGFLPAVAGCLGIVPCDAYPQLSPQFRPGLHPPPFRVFEFQRSNFAVQKWLNHVNPHRITSSKSWRAFKTFSRGRVNRLIFTSISHPICTPCGRDLNFCYHFLVLCIVTFGLKVRCLSHPG